MTMTINGFNLSTETIDEITTRVMVNGITIADVEYDGFDSVYMALNGDKMLVCMNSLRDVCLVLLRRVMWGLV